MAIAGKSIARAARALGKVVPGWLKARVHAEASSILNFVRFAANHVGSSEKVLDAGAGMCPYKPYFSHAIYESTDFPDIFSKHAKDNHTFICSLDNIPKPEREYDAILCTQVLEHVEYPQKVISEFYRVLKPGGKLFLTAPQGWGIHGAPYHFFNFTQYGLRSLFENASFHVEFIKPRGGIFWYLGNRIRKLPPYLLTQYLFRKVNDRIVLKPSPMAIVVAALYLLATPFCGLLFPLACYYLDRLDKARDYTLGYSCFCTKSAEA